MKKLQNNYGKYFEDFHIGDFYSHYPAKAITESDNNLFCLLTMNHHPVHLDKEYAAKQIHRKILVVGTYILSLAVGMSVRDISGKAIANLDYEKVNHVAPVFIGDTIRAETEILSIRESRTKPDQGIIFVETKAYNQKEELVLSLKRHILVPKKKSK
ncbi:MAG: MaoC family dehydratase [Candidatus Cloacimonadota bacterium]|nr:MaoC family dehydratase [Candidatus Cloacimonadota bacterium]